MPGWAASLHVLPRLMTSQCCPRSCGDGSALRADRVAPVLPLLNTFALCALCAALLFFPSSYLLHLCFLESKDL